MSEEHGCTTCAWRAKYDNNPKSISGRLWRFHAKFCPGWKAFMRSLPEGEKQALVEKYRLPAKRFA